MFVTNEYSCLIGNDCEDVVLIPNKKFEAFEGKYKVSAYARVLDEDGKEVAQLQAGDIIHGIGEVKPMTATRLKQLQKESDNRYRQEMEKVLKKPRVRKKKEVKDGNKL